MKALLASFSDGVDHEVRWHSVTQRDVCAEAVEQDSILPQGWAEVKKAHPEEVS